MSVPDNQSEDKHVESSLVPRLDEGSNPSSSTDKKTQESHRRLLRFFVSCLEKNRGCFAMRGSPDWVLWTATGYRLSVEMQRLIV